MRHCILNWAQFSMFVLVSVLPYAFILIVAAALLQTAFPVFVCVDVCYRKCFSLSALELS